MSTLTSLKRLYNKLTGEDSKASTNSEAINELTEAGIGKTEPTVLYLWRESPMASADRLTYYPPLAEENVDVDTRDICRRAHAGEKFIIRQYHYDGSYMTTYVQNPYNEYELYNDPVNVHFATETLSYGSGALTMTIETCVLMSGVNEAVVHGGSYKSN